MKTHALTIKIRARKPKNVRSCESAANIYRALVINPGAGVYFDEQRVYARNLEVPSGLGVGTARAIARGYSVFASGGRELGLRRETLDLLAAPAIPPTRGSYDECMKGEGLQFSLGFMKPSAVWPFGSPNSFGAPGSGGASGLCRSCCWRRLRLCDEPDGHAPNRRPARYGAQRRALLGYPERSTDDR